MSAERVTVTLSSELRRAGIEEAEAAGTSFSAVVSNALEAHLRGRIIDAYLHEYQEEHGAFTEEEIRRFTSEAGVPYVPPGRLDQRAAG